MNLNITLVRRQKDVNVNVTDGLLILVDLPFLGLKRYGQLKCMRIGKAKSINV